MVALALFLKEGGVGVVRQRFYCYVNFLPWKKVDIMYLIGRNIRTFSTAAPNFSLELLGPYHDLANTV